MILPTVNLPTVELEVIGSKKSEKIEAVIDTGFAGHLCIPFAIGEKLGLELSGVVETVLGDGQWVKQYEFSGKVRFMGRMEDVAILLTSGSRSQVGLLLLAELNLSIDFPANKVQLTRKKM